jgi:hypothetical protein
VGGTAPRIRVDAGEQWARRPSGERIRVFYVILVIIAVVVLGALYFVRGRRNV